MAMKTINIAQQETLEEVKSLVNGIGEFPTFDSIIKGTVATQNIDVEGKGIITFYYKGNTNTLTIIVDGETLENFTLGSYHNISFYFNESISFKGSSTSATSYIAYLE